MFVLIQLMVSELSIKSFCNPLMKSVIINFIVISAHYAEACLLDLE